MIEQVAVYRARRFGDDINTDYIIASHRKRETVDPAKLREYIFESIAPGFSASIEQGDVIVAGKNFGCGSAMEVAATVLKAAGMMVIVAESFARTFYRNAINNGLLPIVANVSEIRDGDELKINFDHGQSIEICRLKIVIQAEPIPNLMLQIFDNGGLMPFLSKAENIHSRRGN